MGIINNLKQNKLNKFQYIAIKFHFKDEKYYNNTITYYNVIKKLSRTHQSFYFRCNGRSKIINFGFNKICRAIEVSYVIKKNNTFKKDEAIYPIFKFVFSKPNLGKFEMNLNLSKVFEN